ncbi:MAG: hypothetical protein ABIP19_08030 [Dermatophilaceae bacterium]
MRLQRVLAVASGVALVVALGTTPTFGATAPPSLENTSAPRARPPMPLPLPPVGPYTAADEPQPTVAPDSSSLSAGARALVDDRDAAVISASDFSKYALGKLGYGYKVPHKYNDSAMSELDSMTLTQAVNTMWPEVPTADKATIANETRTYSYPDETSTPTSLLTSSPCGPRYRIAQAVYNCSLSTAHFLVRWAATGPTALPPPNQVDTDADGIPDFVTTTAETLERAWTTYSGLGYTAPSTVTVVVNGLLSGGTGLALPGTFVTGPGSIQLPGDYDARYLPAHELFHQFQYSYIHPRIPFLLPGAAGLRLASLTRAVLNLNWWMEATAEWASQKYAQANNTWFTDPVTPFLYARNIQVFMQHPEYEIERRDALAGARQYGEMVLPEFLEERFDTAFVRRVWENVAGDFLPDSTSDLADTALEYDTSIGDVLSDFWASLYKVCDPYSSPWDGTLTLSDPDVSAWCTRYINRSTPLSSGAPGAGIFRLPHTVASVADAGSASLTAGGGGARILDLTSSTSSASNLVTVQAGTNPNIGNVSVRVAQWQLSPGDRCDTDQLVKIGAGSTTTFSFMTTPACPNVTFIATNTGYAGIERTANLSWTVQATAAVISNGLIQLGVNAAGQLNAPGTVPSSGTQTTTVGLRYLPTGADSIAPGCLCEGWGVKIVDSSGNVVAGSANESWGGARGLQVVSFTSTATEATSVVRLGDYTVTHYFHPSPDNRVYQVDVSVSGGNVLFPPTVTYRRIVDFDVEPTAFEEFISIHVDDADLPEVLTTTNNGFNDPDPRTAASSRGATGSFTDYGPMDQGALFDLRIPISGAFSPPSATLYYGAGTDSADAAAALTAVGVLTYAMAKPSSTTPPTGAPNTFVLGYKPGG